jgi:hypothetical protein
MKNVGTEKIRWSTGQWIARRQEVKTTMTKDDLRAMLEAYDGKIELVAPRFLRYRFDMCKARWSTLGGVSLCNFTNPVERAKSVMEVLKR